MKYSIFIEPNRDEEIIVYAHEKNKLVERIERLIFEESSALIGYTEREAVKLDADDIACFFSEGGKVFAMVGGQKYAVKPRLYQLEEQFGDFLKINQSCIVRPGKIKHFDHSLAGALTVTLEGGYKDYVSRRQLKKVKERIGL